jgi:hypothetical protein
MQSTSLLRNGAASLNGNLRTEIFRSLPALTPGRVPHVRPRRTWAEYEYFFDCFQLMGRERSMGLHPGFSAHIRLGRT